MKLTQERLKELLYYNPETGVFTWLVSRQGHVRIGDVAGNIHTSGYRNVKVDGINYRASRLAWLWMEGYFPENEVDHRDRVRHNDRWNNLRHISRVCNSRNCNISKNNKSGITGVCWHKLAGKWWARIKIPDKEINLGLFQSKLDAARARWQAEVKHGFPNCNTTSTAFLYLKKCGKTMAQHS